MKTVTIDIETVLDQDLAERCGYAPSEEFAPFPLHTIVCASAFSVTRTPTGTPLYSLESFSGRTMSERGIIASVEDAVSDANLVFTYNGAHFDLPVLVNRATVHEVHVPKLIDLQNRSRVGRHMDLFQEVKRGAEPVSLRQLCAPFSIPVKQGAAIRVADLVEAADWDALEQYCEMDAVACWLAAQFWTKVQEPGQARETWQNLAAWILASASEYPSLAPFATVPGPPRAKLRAVKLETLEL